MKSGILLIDKPPGFTSHDVVAKMRGILKMKKIGHSGTLDPMATGVLPLFLGTATRACDRLTNHDKEYVATVQLGTTTDTQDITGTVLGQRPVTVGRTEVEAALQGFLGESDQLPPMYSAIQIDGKRLYDLARQGKEIDRPTRQITIYAIELLEMQPESQRYTFRVACSKGTYVRTICHDLGERLGCGGCLAELRRTVANGFLIGRCLTLDQVEEQMRLGKLEQQIISVDQVFGDFSEVLLEEDLAGLFLNGVPLWLSQFALDAQASWLRIYRKNGQFLGIAYADRQKNQLTMQKQMIGEIPD